MKNVFIGFKKVLDENFNISLMENENIIKKILFQIEVIEEIINKTNKAANIMMKEVVYDLETSIYSGLIGLYRNAYISLRSEIELCLAYIYFVDHNYNYIFWKRDIMAQLVEYLKKKFQKNIQNFSKKR